MRLVDLYRRMARARALEVALAELWERGLIPGELHLATGEEAIAAALSAHLRDEDAVALDHRATPHLLLRGVDARALLAECMGREDGLCGGRGGHMHLFSKAHRAASSGIVGAAAPAATGLALAGRSLRSGSVAVGLFGDGALNQGMVLESLNLAVAWKLPVVFVCKDNGWAIVTRSAALTGGDPAGRARAFGLFTESVDGGDAMATWGALGRCIDHARRGRGPAFLHARCPRLDGHFLGDPVLRMLEKPSEAADVLRDVVSSAIRRDGGSIRRRARSMGHVTSVLVRAQLTRRGGRNDPLVRARRRLGQAMQDEVARIDAAASAEVERAVRSVDGRGAA